MTFKGNTTFASWSLRQVLATQPRPKLLPWKRGEPYNLATVEADLRRLKKFYFERGYLDMTAHVAEVKEDPEANAVDIAIRIEEGTPTQVIAVDITGTLPPEIPSKENLLLDLILRVDRPINKEDFDASQAILGQHLKNAGYARARVIPRTEVDPQTHTARVSWSLQPGEKTRFGKIWITGAEHVRERAIRRQFTIREGQIYSPQKLEKTTDNIYGLGMFQTVNPQAHNLEETTAPLDIEIAVRERKRRTLEFGLGFSTVDSLLLQTEWLHRNLFNGSERLTLTAKVSGIGQGVETRLNLPYVLVERLSFTQTVFALNLQKLDIGPFGKLDELFNIEDPFPAFDILVLGGRSRFGYRLTDRLTGYLGFEHSRTDYRNIDRYILSESDTTIAQDNTLLIQFAELRWDTSNDLLNPTQGGLLRGRVEHSIALVFSDVNFFKLVLEMRHYHRLRRQTVLATRFMIGAIQPYGDHNNVPFNVRFLSGGPGSVRGFAINRLGPLDANGDPIGGNSLIEGNIELRFPIRGDFGGAFFVDFGQVFDDAFTYRLKKLRFTAGPGIRFDTLVGPLRLDVGFIIDNLPKVVFGRIEFSIGQAF